jgi:hypothetical protein
MNRANVREKMRRLAQVSPEFKVIHDFFRELTTLKDAEYIICCRAHMPRLADHIAAQLGTTTPMLAAMKKAPCLSDKEVVDLSAAFLSFTVKTMENV